MKWDIQEKNTVAQSLHRIRKVAPETTQQIPPKENYGDKQILRSNR